MYDDEWHDAYYEARAMVEGFVAAWDDDAWDDDMTNTATAVEQARAWLERPV